MPGMTRRAADVAAHLRASFDGFLPTKKLHKLLYYCQGHHLAATGRPLFIETVSAWDMGPVVGSLWWQEKEGGPLGTTVALDESELNTIGYVLSRYGRLTGADLERLTHNEPPWLTANEGRRPGESTRIGQDLLLHYFSNETEDSEEEPAFDSAEVSRWLAETTADPLPHVTADTRERLKARLADAR